MKTRFRIGLVATLLMMATGGSHGEVVVPYDSTGQFDGVDVPGQTVVIDDQAYRLGYGIPVYSSGGYLTNVGNLAVGQPIGFSVTGNAPATVTGIWVLQSGSNNVE